MQSATNVLRASATTACKRFAELAGEDPDPPLCVSRLGAAFPASACRALRGRCAASPLEPYGKGCQLSPPASARGDGDIHGQDTARQGVGQPQSRAGRGLRRQVDGLGRQLQRPLPGDPQRVLLGHDLERRAPAAQDPLDAEPRHAGLPQPHARMGAAFEGRAHQRRSPRTRSRPSSTRSPSMPACRSASSASASPARCSPSSTRPPEATSSRRRCAHRDPGPHACH